MATKSTRAVVLVAGILLVVGSFMTWVTVDVGFAQFSTVGMDTVDGKLTAIAGGVVGLMAIALGLKGRMGTIAAVLGIDAAIFGAIVLGNEYVDVRQRIADAEPGAATATLGIGVWLTALGALAAIGVLAWFLVAQRRSAAQVANA